jgi:hypothetical protein
VEYAAVNVSAIPGIEVRKAGIADVGMAVSVEVGVGVNVSVAVGALGTVSVAVEATTASEVDPVMGI